MGSGRCKCIPESVHSCKPTIDADYLARLEFNRRVRSEAEQLAETPSRVPSFLERMWERNHPQRAQCEQWALEIVVEAAVQKYPVE
jgi:hypothetical protein